MKKLLSLAVAAAAIVLPVCALDESIPIEKAPEIRLVTSDPSVSIPAVVIAGALAEGVERAYLCTESDDTAWQMYEKFGFERAGAFTWAFWQL